MGKMIYMPLLGEGTDCWRPVRAVQIHDDVFEVVDEITVGESWAFAPHSRVRCRDSVFADGQRGLAIFAYAIESHPYYKLLKDHEGQIFRIAFADGEQSVVKVVHVDEEYEDFIYDLLSTNLQQKYPHGPTEAAYAAKFADLVSAQLEEQSSAP
ncbi:MAG TPA: hypothetical protein VLW06_05995 [Terriglobales bacterium]|nr:hypothetical protein [Terriglobales bacterium]